MGRLIHKKVFSLKTFVIPVLLFSHSVALSVKKKTKNRNALGREESYMEIKSFRFEGFFLTDTFSFFL